MRVSLSRCVACASGLIAACPQEHLTIVTNAPNVSEGSRVVVATVGSMVCKKFQNSCFVSLCRSRYSSHNTSLGSFLACSLWQSSSCSVVRMIAFPHSFPLHGCVTVVATILRCAPRLGRRLSRRQLWVVLSPRECYVRPHAPTP